MDKKSSKKDEPIFEIGNEAQTVDDFQRQIATRFGTRSNFKKAWAEALKIVRSFDEATLKSQHEFYEIVYRPRRDPLSRKWTEEFAE